MKEGLPAERFFAAIVGPSGEGEPSPAQTVLFLLTNTLLIGGAAGWFGSKLLPKLVPESRIRSRDSGAI